MSGRWEIATLCWALSTVRGVTSIAVVIKEIQFASQSDFNANLAWLIDLVLAVGALNDVLIAAGLSFYLISSRTGLKRSVTADI